MKKLIISVLFSGIVLHVHGQNFIQAYQDRVNLVSQANITSNLQQFESLGVKTTGSVNNTNTFNWIKNKYLSYGYSVSQMEEDSFTYGNSTSKNLIITKTGTTYPNTYVIVCGHFDSIYGPGVNDNGSGTSILLEAARILKDIPTEYSIKFIHFSGEEQGLIGSSHYVNTIAYPSNGPQLDIKLVFNIDEVGGKSGSNNDTVYCDQDQGGVTTNNAAATVALQELIKCTTLYSPLKTAIDRAENTDYIPFERKGAVITGYYEKVQSPYPHTANDTFANLDPVYVYNIGKASVGAIQHFAVASTATNTLRVEEIPASPLSSVKIYPNPVKDNVLIQIPSSLKVNNLKVKIVDLTGNTLIETKNKKSINVSHIPEGVYWGIITVNDQETVRKIVIDK
ncbi:M28 family peptidase [Chryseobacterium sp. CT-SW4]|uniref:M28 family peptidase n=1 Tax=Chryseobacterium sp. SW-1 TaxID=3157343 RepID=UPI003B0294DE